ncbi:predicted protein [Arabidopsis lyrata subsp. lyrata]|uniref:Predicted protein n=1 Tax=Arabidopsis lyrata subsp. lyrata TaxID=81972 RepID=D7KFD3_ARALL|nr:predicted protein [Arabidopsis lyrata subsp. lyrata]
MGRVREGVTVRWRSELNNTSLTASSSSFASTVPLMAVPIATCRRIYSSTGQPWNGGFNFIIRGPFLKIPVFASVPGLFFSSQPTRLAASFVPSYRILVSPSITMMDHWSQPSG